MTKEIRLMEGRKVIEGWKPLEELAKFQVGNWSVVLRQDIGGVLVGDFTAINTDGISETRTMTYPVPDLPKLNEWLKKTHAKIYPQVRERGAVKKYF